MRVANVLGSGRAGHTPGCSFNGYSWANFFRSSPAMSSPDLSGWVSIWAPNRSTQDARVFLLVIERSRCQAIFTRSRGATAWRGNPGVGHSEFAAVGCGGYAVEAGGDPLHGRLTVDERRQ